MTKPKPQKIWLAHLTNDRSGSPRVLQSVAHCLLQLGYNVHICTSNSQSGLLSNLPGVHYHFVNYAWSANRLLTLARYTYSQLYTFLLMVFSVRRSDIVYCNTLLSAGASLAGRIRGARVIYHVHEFSVSPASLDGLLKTILAKTAHSVLFVSAYLQQYFSGKAPRPRLIENCLSPEFETALDEGWVAPPSHKFTVTLACSLKHYKGIHEFARLAALLPNMQFWLASSAPEKDVQHYRETYGYLKNLNAQSQQADMVNVYRNSHVIINLSVPEHFVETFGLTLVEAMACGRPVIAPAIGGPLGIVEHGADGYLFSVPDLAGIAHALQNLQQNDSLYHEMSKNALKKADKYRRQRFCHELFQAINDR